MFGIGLTTATCHRCHSDENDNENDNDENENEKDMTHEIRWMFGIGLTTATCHQCQNDENDNEKVYENDNDEKENGMKKRKRKLLRMTMMIMRLTYSWLTDRLR